MPWNVEKNEECPAAKPWGVVKEAGGTLVGCHATAEEARAQQAALYANERSGIMSKLREIWEQFKARFESEIAAADEAERAEGGGTAGWTELAQTLPRQPGQEVIVRQGDGTVRWLNVSATAVLNRVGEIDSRDLFDQLIARCGGDLSGVKRDFFHLGEFSPDFILGDVDGLWRDDAVFISTGTYHDAPLAQAVVRAIEKDPAAWGDSIAYLPIGEPETIDVDGAPVPVYRDGVLRFIATLPENRAASHLTSTIIQEAPMKADIMAALSGLDLDETTRQRFADLVDNINGAAAALINREAATETETAPEIPATGTPAAELPAPEVPPDPAPLVLDEALVGEIVRQMGESEVVAALQAAITQLQQVVDGLGTKTEEAVQEESAKAERALVALAERLAALERTDEEKHRTWAADMPTAPVTRATFRPREAHADQGDQPEPSNVRAERIIKEKKQRAAA